MKESSWDSIEKILDDKEFIKMSNSTSDLYVNGYNPRELVEGLNNWDRF